MQTRSAQTIQTPQTGYNQVQSGKSVTYGSPNMHTNQNMQRGESTILNVVSKPSSVDFENVQTSQSNHVVQVPNTQSIISADQSMQTNQEMNQVDNTNLDNIVNQQSGTITQETNVGTLQDILPSATTTTTQQKTSYNQNVLPKTPTTTASSSSFSSSASNEPITINAPTTIESNIDTQNTLVLT